MDNPSGAITDNSNSAQGSTLQARVADHEKAILALEAERALLVKRLEALQAEKLVLQAVALKVATRRPSGGGTSGGATGAVVGGGQEL
jgi:hypothetical protein